MAKTITWKDIENRTCVLTIDDGSSGTTALTPGAAPFITAIDESDDLFQPIRTSTGNIGIVIDSVDEIVSMVGRTPISTPVTLTVAGTTRWVGFLNCESFSQEWDRGPLDITLPVKSGLEVLKGIRYPYIGLSSLGYINFAYLINQLNESLGNIYVSFYFPNVSNPSETLTYKFRMANYATPDSKNTTYEMATYYDILEDICKLFGWQAIEYGASLVFLAADVKAVVNGNNMKEYTAADIAIIGGGASVVGQNISFATVVPEFYGVDHRRSFVAGKNKVDVVGNLNEIPKSIWSMDVFDQCKFNGNEYHAPDNFNFIQYTVKKMACISNGNIEVHNNVFSGGAVAPDTEGNNIKYTDAFTDSHNVYGGSITYEQFAKYNGAGSSIITEGSADFFQRLILKAYTEVPIVCAKISTNFYYTPTQNAQYNAFRINADVKYAATARDAFDSWNGLHEIEMSFVIVNGNTEYYYDRINGWTTNGGRVILTCYDGKIDEGSYNRISVPTNISGELVIYIWASTDTTTGQGTGYLALENIEILMFTKEGRVAGREIPRIELSEIRGNNNEDKIDLNNGFSDEWSQSCGLTLAREPVSDSNGVVLTSYLTLPVSLYGNKYPEKAMCDRVATYAAKARMVLFAVVKGSGKLLSPFVCYKMNTNDRPWICLCQTVNWQNNEIKAGFFEPSYEM